MKRAMCLVILMVVCLWVATVNAADPNEKTGITAWALGGSGVQELRVGLEGLLPTIEFAGGIRHVDAPDGGIEEWPIRGYVIAHALDAKMLASVLGADLELPDGNLYGGLFGEYSFDREEEWSCGYVIGGLVDFPKGWQTVIEYGATLWNTTNREYELMLGLRRLF